MKSETKSLIWLAPTFLALAGIFGIFIWFAVIVLQHEMEQADQADNATNEIPWDDIGGEPFQYDNIYIDSEYFTGEIYVDGELIYPFPRVESITITPEPEIITEYIEAPPPDPVEFSSPTELKKYLADWYATRGVWITNGAPGACELWADALDAKARRDNMKISLQTTGLHRMNQADIGNEIWFIEPQTCEAWFYAYKQTPK